MIRLNGKPFLEYIIQLLKENGVKKILILTGYKSKNIIKYFGDGKKMGIKIQYSLGKLGWKTGKRLKIALSLLNDHFLLLYSDNYWPLNLKKMTNFYAAIRKPAMITIYSNKDKFTNNNIFINDKSLVQKYDQSRTNKRLNGVDIGYFILNKKIVLKIPDQNVSFEHRIIPSLIRKKQLVGFVTSHKYYSIGRMERLTSTENFLKFKKAVILDRDGVINVKPKKSDYVTNWDEFVWKPNVCQALSRLKKAGYLLIVATNQAGIARGQMTINDLKDIHEHMQHVLRKAHAEIDKIYYCPHGWNDGCDCRKPKPGMIFKAQREFDLDLTKTWFIGDDRRDKLAAEAAGCKFIRISKNQSLSRIVKKKLLSYN